MYMGRIYKLNVDYFVPNNKGPWTLIVEAESKEEEDRRAFIYSFNLMDETIRNKILDTQNQPSAEPRHLKPKNCEDVLYWIYRRLASHFEDFNSCQLTLYEEPDKYVKEIHVERKKGLLGLLCQRFK